ncbi:MAG: hypothetical protein PHE73_01200 [Sulfurovaceae bacterium]|nr:hypothetical protein [Sulfurovaceae bacterium]
MRFLSKVLHRTILLFQFLLVLFYLFFEELIWNGIAVPIYNFLESLRLLQTIEKHLKHINGRIVVLLFLVLFGFAEGLGIVAGIVAVSGKLFLGIVLYAAKIPIAAFAFWLFRVTKKKLMAFEWFAFLYNALEIGLSRLKSLDIYISTMDLLHETKTWIKTKAIIIKTKLFKHKGNLLKKFKKLYDLAKRKNL